SAQFVERDRPVGGQGRGLRRGGRDRDHAVGEDLDGSALEVLEPAWVRLAFVTGRQSEGALFAAEGPPCGADEPPDDVLAGVRHRVDRAALEVVAAGDLVAGSRLLGGPLAGGRVGQRSELPAALGAGGLAPLGADPTADLVGVAVGDQRVPVDGLVVLEVLPSAAAGCVEL